MTWRNTWWSHCHQKYPWTGVIYLLTFYSHYPCPGAHVRAGPGMLQVSFGGFLSTTVIHVNSFLPFLFSCCPWDGVWKPILSQICLPELTAGKRDDFGSVLNMVFFKIYIGLFENTKRALSSCLYETSLLQRFGQWSLCPHSKCRALLCNTRSNNWIKSIRKGRAKEWSPHPSWIGLLSVP